MSCKALVVLLKNENQLKRIVLHTLQDQSWDISESSLDHTIILLLIIPFL